MQFIARTLLLLMCPCAIFAARWSVDDVLLAERAGEFELSRDGARLVWVKSSVDEKKGRTISNLILSNLEEDYEVQLTRGKDRNSSPKFSPDGRRIAFLSNREPLEDPDDENGEEEGEQNGDESKRPAQVWLIDTRGGEPYSLTRFKKDAKELHWLDNDTLLVTATEDPSFHEQRNKKRKDTSVVVEDEDHAPPVRLFRLDVETKETARLTDNTDRITMTAVSPDGAWAVTVHERSLRYVYDQQVRPVTFLHDLKKGTSRQLLPTGSCCRPRSSGASIARASTSRRPTPRIRSISGPRSCGCTSTTWPPGVLPRSLWIGTGASPGTSRPRRTGSPRCWPMASGIAPLYTGAPATAGRATGSKASTPQICSA